MIRSRRIFSGTSGSGGGGANITVVDTYADLPVASSVTGEFYFVKTTTGSGSSTKPAGLYYSDGTSWYYDDSNTDIVVVANYSALPVANTVTGSFYWCESSQGTKWLPGSLGGTYYPSGLYYSNGVSWEYMETPYQATQSEVDAGTVTDKFVTPSTLYNATRDFIQFDIVAPGTPGPGKVAYNGATGALAYLMDNTNVMSNIGQTLHAYVHNADSVTITKGQPVYLFSASGNKASVKLANNTSDATSAKTLGLAAEDITSGQNGFIMCQGSLDGVNTGMYIPGDTLYVGASAGALTNVKPYAPNHLVYVGVVERANAGNGQIYVRSQNGYELDEIHDVDLITIPPVVNDALVYNGSLWTASATANSASDLFNYYNFI
jgi:hypothetical protein